MYLDIKCTIWERVKLNENMANTFKHAVKEGKSDSEIRALIRDLIDEEDEDEGAELLYDTWEYMPKENNNDDPTMELLDEDFNTVITN